MGAPSGQDALPLLEHGGSDLKSKQQHQSTSINQKEGRIINREGAKNKGELETTRRVRKE